MLSTVFMPSLISLIVIERLGPVANAHFYVPALIATGLSVVAMSIVRSFLVEASHEPHLLRKHAPVSYTHLDVYKRQADVDIVGRVAEASRDQRLPEKRNFGSDFSFHDFGQLAGVRGSGDVNTHVISGAYGGFSNTWGAQTMVYSAASFNDWPISRAELEVDYRSILSKICLLYTSRCV